MQRWILVGLATTGLLAVHAIVAAIVLPRLRERAARYNLRRVLNLATALLIAFSVISVLFALQLVTPCPFGLFSLSILGFALQAPPQVLAPGSTSSCARRTAWAIIPDVAGQATGDVIDVAYLDTTLWEFGGEFLLDAATEPGQSSRFPNSTVFNSTVFQLLSGRSFRTSGTRSRCRWRASDLRRRRS